jgi:hypothetical protein
MQVGSALQRTRRWIDDNIFRSDGLDFTRDQDMTEAQQVRLVQIGAAGGAAVGGLVGGLAGYANEQKDQVREVWEHRDIKDPSLRGWHHGHTELGHYETYYTTETRTYTDSNGNTQTETYQQSHQRWHHDGWRHYYDADVEWRDVGDYKVPKLEHSKAINLLTGTMLGMAGGAAVGAATGVGAALLLRWVRQRDPVAGAGPTPQPAPRPSVPVTPFAPALPADGFLDRVADWIERKVDDFDNAEFGTKLKAGTTAGGALLGGTVGYLAGQAQAERQVVITRTYPVPDLESRHLGRIPSDYNEYDWGGGWWGPSHHGSDGSHGWDNVHRDAPRYDGQGQVVMKQQTETLSSKQFGPVLGAVTGAALGAGVGFLGGVAIDVLMHFRDEPEH